MNRFQFRRLITLYSVVTGIPMLLVTEMIWDAKSNICMHFSMIYYYYYYYLNDTTNSELIRFKCQE